MTAVTSYPVYPHSFNIKAVATICNLNLQGFLYYPLTVILAEQKQFWTGICYHNCKNVLKHLLV